MSSDIFTKNLPQDSYNKHTTTYCGNDKYMNTSELGNVQAEEGVRCLSTPPWYLDISKMTGANQYVRGHSYGCEDNDNNQNSVGLCQQGMDTTGMAIPTDLTRRKY